MQFESERGELGEGLQTSVQDEDGGGHGEGGDHKVGEASKQGRDSQGRQCDRGKKEKLLPEQIGEIRGGRETARTEDVHAGEE